MSQEQEEYFELFKTKEEALKFEDKFLETIPAGLRPVFKNEATKGIKTAKYWNVLIDAWNREFTPVMQKRKKA